MLIIISISCIIAFLKLIDIKILQKNIIITNNQNIKKGIINKLKKGENAPEKKCHISSDNSNLKILHLIITRFMIEFYHKNDFPKKLYKKEFIENAIRVMKKYLFPSLENQTCKNFTWILMIGDQANITYISNLLNFNSSFPIEFIFQKDIKSYLLDRSKKFDILITTRIDYDDRIYYDAVNDVRKEINIKKPLLLHGYNRGFIYYESIDKYEEYHYTNKKGVWSVFISLIIVVKKVKAIYTIYDFGDHTKIKSNLLKNYKLYGINKLNYEPVIFDDGTPKFVWVQQKYSGSYNSNRLNKMFDKKHFKSINFDINKFYGN